MQVNGLALSFSFQWDAAMSGFLDIQGQITSLGTAYMEFQCLGNVHGGGNGFVIDSLVYLLAPVFVGLVVFIVYFLRILSVSKDLGKSVRLAMAPVGGPIVAILFVLQPFLVERFALIFSCVQLGRNADDLFMVANLQVRCWKSSTHQLYMVAFGVPFFFFYVIGIPVGLYRLMADVENEKNVLNIIYLMCPDLEHEKQLKAKHELGEEKDRKAGHIPTVSKNHYQKSAQSISATQIKSARSINYTFFKNYSFLFLGYKPKAYWWEVVIICRKGLISLVGVIFVFDKRAQGMLGMVIIFLVSVLHASIKPFIDSRFNNFELLSLMTSASTFFFGIFTLDGGDNGQVFNAASSFALLVNVLYFFISIWRGYHDYKWRPSHPTSTEFPRPKYRADSLELTAVNGKLQQAADLISMIDAIYMKDEVGALLAMELMRHESVIEAASGRGVFANPSSLNEPQPSEVAESVASQSAAPPLVTCDTQLMPKFTEVVSVTELEERKKTAPKSDSLITSSWKPDYAQARKDKEESRSPSSKVNSSAKIKAKNARVQIVHEVEIKSQNNGELFPQALNFRKYLTVAYYPFEAKQPNQLSFDKGDIIEVPDFIFIYCFQNCYFIEFEYCLL